jgi:Tannase and feruloyl esterase
MLAVGTPAAFATNCANLALLTLPNTTLTAQSYSAGQTIATGLTAPVDLCRVVGHSTPTAASNINFEVWLPEKNWSGRFQQIGNGGFAGSIPRSTMPAIVGNGNVAAATDDGSSLQPGQPAGSFGRSRDRLVDYVGRAVHMTNNNAKALIQAFYGKKPKYSYFAGCSKGGGESQFEVQRYPEDFDGILGGAAANRSTEMNTGWMWNIQAVLSNNPGFVPAANVAGALVPAMLSQCTRAKAAPTDLFLSYPDKCKIDFSKLLCHGAPSSSCLTQPQINGVEAVLDGPRTSRGVKVGAGYEPDFQAWVGNVVSRGQTPPATPDTSQAGFAIGVFGQWLNPPVTVANFNIDTDWPSFVAQLGSVIDIIDPDLRAFKRRGGKMIQYHGMADGLVSTMFSIETFNNVVDFNRSHDGHGHDNSHDKGRGHENGDESDALAETRDFYRLFLVPGMGHCSGGQGPTSFGASATGTIANGSPNNDIFVALEQWVEKGIPPRSIIAAGTNNGVTPSVPFTRPLCPYPQTAVYKTGDTNQASSFVCQADNGHDDDDDHGNDHDHGHDNDHDHGHDNNQH